MHDEGSQKGAPDWAIRRAHGVVAEMNHRDRQETDDDVFLARAIVAAVADARRQAAKVAVDGPQPPRPTCGLTLSGERPPDDYDDWVCNLQRGHKPPHAVRMGTSREEIASDILALSGDPAAAPAPARGGA